MKGSRLTSGRAASLRMTIISLIIALVALFLISSVLYSYALKPAKEFLGDKYCSIFSTFGITPSSCKREVSYSFEEIGNQIYLHINYELSSSEPVGGSYDVTLNDDKNNQLHKDKVKALSRKGSLVDWRLDKGLDGRQLTLLLKYSTGKEKRVNLGFFTKHYLTVEAPLVVQIKKKLIRNALGKRTLSFGGRTIKDYYLVHGRSSICTPQLPLSSLSSQCVEDTFDKETMKRCTPEEIDMLFKELVVCAEKGKHKNEAELNAEYNALLSNAMRNSKEQLDSLGFLMVKENSISP